MIKRISNSPKIEWYPVKVSTVFPAGALTYWDGSGFLIPADDTSGDHAGVIMQPIAATDENYAVARKVMIDVPATEDIFEADVTTGTLTTAMVGNQYDLNATGDGINVSAQAKKVITVVGFVSATKALIKVNAIETHLRVVTT